MVCFNRIVLAEFDRENALDAHIVQFGALYVFGASYQMDAKDKLLPENIRNLFDFITCALFIDCIRERG